MEKRDVNDKLGTANNSDREYNRKAILNESIINNYLNRYAATTTLGYTYVEYRIPDD